MQSSINKRHMGEQLHPGSWLSQRREAGKEAPTAWGRQCHGGVSAQLGYVAVAVLNLVLDLEQCLHGL
eukprot:scaffold150854_cov17-Tisochrysis_lutea.AAC.1